MAGLLPANVRLLAELLAVQPQLDARSGKKRLELLFEDGRLVDVFVHGRVSPRILEAAEVAEIPPESS